MLVLAKNTSSPAPPQKKLLMEDFGSELTKNIPPQKIKTTHGGLKDLILAYTQPAAQIIRILRSTNP